MAAGIAHEVRNPLTSIRGYADLIYKSLPADDNIKSYSKIVVDEVKRLNNIVQNVLNFARKAEPEAQPTNLNSLVEGLIVLVEKDASYNNVEIVLDLDPDLPTVMADGTQIKQVFLNLAQNAIQAMPGGGKLTISSRRSAGGAEVSFVDQGSGIPPEHLSRIFDPFFTTKQGGTGLGLSVSYRIIENHRGSIEVTSKVGAGSTFKVKLPAKSVGQS
jgi:two-component system sporulation sensor kinase A/two-component system, sporulation sensor kinase E